MALTAGAGGEEEELKRLASRERWPASFKERTGGYFFFFLAAFLAAFFFAGMNFTSNLG